MQRNPKTKQMSRQKASRQSNLNRKTSQRKKLWNQKDTRKMVSREKQEWCAERRGCQEKKVSRKEPKDRDAKRKRRQRKGAEKASVSGEKGVSSLRLQSCQEEGLSRFRDVKGKPDQEKVASSDKMSREKQCQAERLTQPTAVTARQSGVVPRGSPFSL